jgi:hypothetical protein
MELHGGDQPLGEDRRLVSDELSRLAPQFPVKLDRRVIYRNSSEDGTDFRD